MKSDVFYFFTNRPFPKIKNREIIRSEVKGLVGRKPDLSASEASL